LSSEKGFDDLRAVVHDMLFELNTMKKRHIFLDNLFRKHEADDCDYNPISLEPLS
jgi:hypothetical protein